VLQPWRPFEINIRTAGLAAENLARVRMAQREQQMWRAVTGVMLAALLSHVVASAEPGPKLIPDRDVDITYRVNPADEPAFNQRVRWQGDTHLERVDGPRSATVIVDHTTHYEILLRPETHSYLKLAVPAGSNLYPNADIARTNKGQAWVAGLPCTEWEWTAHEDNKTHSLCVTDDGVLLRETADGHIMLQAKSVKYRKLKPAIFTVPDNYEPSLIPAGPTD
jgi:hypothetical protein